MLNKFEALNQTFEEKLLVVESENQNMLSRLQQIIYLVDETLTVIDVQICPSKLLLRDQIVFYKKLLPQITSHKLSSEFLMNYYRAIPIGTKLEKRNNIKRHQKALYTSFSNNLELITYLRSDYSHNDKEYFLHNATFTNDIVAVYNSLNYLENYLENELVRIASTENSSISTDAVFRFTRDKTDAVELCYALLYSKSINNGKMPINQIAVHVSNFLNIEIKDVYGKWNDVKARKSKSNFMEELNNCIQFEINKSNSK